MLMNTRYNVPYPVQYAQYVGANTWVYTGVRRILVNVRTKYQHVIIAELEDFGKALILDGLIQSAQVDEYIYHESLVHPAMVTNSNPSRVLILGAGEGASIREVIKYRCVKEVDAVDIDEELIRYVKEYLPEFHNGSFNDHRVREIYTDAVHYVKSALSSGRKYDVVIMDLTDPYGSEVGASAYSIDTFRTINSILSDNGVFVVQSGSSFLFPDEYENVYKAVRDTFPIVREYQVWVPSFFYAESFIIASKNRDPASLSAEYVDSILMNMGVSTRFYNGKVHVALMSLGSYRRQRN